jgi:hypothetical protein
MRLLQRVKNILFKPRLEWDLIAAEKNSFRSLFTGYVLPLALPGAVAAMIGWTAFGVDSVFVTMKGIRWGIYHALDILLGFTLTIVLASLVVDLLAPYFGSEKNLNQSAKLVCYSYTPVMLGMLLSIFPNLAFVGYLFGLYGFYLWWLGLGPLKKTPEEKQVPYMIVSVILIIVVFAGISSLIELALKPLLGVDPLPELKLH